MSDLRFVRELGAEFQRLEAAHGSRRQGWWGSSPEARRGLASVLALGLSVVVVAVVAVVGLSAGHARRNAGPRPSPAVLGTVGGPVPAGFDPLSVTAISDRQWWLLGTRPCPHRACLAIVRTSDGGRRLVSIPAPAVRYEPAGCPVVPVSRLHFADPRDGFAYGCALYVTHDGGARWHKLDLGGYVSQLVTAGGEAYAIVSSPHRPQANRLMRSPVGRDAWATALAASPGFAQVGNGLAARGSDVFVLSVGSSRLLISRDRGASFTGSTLGLGLPCNIQPVRRQVVWAFCSGGMMGSVVRSADGGRRFLGAGGGSNAPAEYNSATFAAADATTAVVGFDQLLRTANAGRSYRPVGPAGFQWEDFEFVGAKYGIAIAAPQSSAPEGSRVYVTNDGGLTYRLVPLSSAGQAPAARGYQPQCRSSQLRLQPGPQVSEKTQQAARVLVLRNTSASACDLEGYPQVMLRDGRGTVLPFTYEHRGDQMLTFNGPSVVRLEPGARAYFGINKTPCERGFAGPHAPNVAARIQATPPHDADALARAIDPYPILDYCKAPDAGHFIDLTPIEPTSNAVLGQP